MVLLTQRFSGTRTRSFYLKERVFHYENASEKVEKSVFTTQSLVSTTRFHPFLFLTFFSWVVRAAYGETASFNSLAPGEFDVLLGKTNKAIQLYYFNI